MPETDTKTKKEKPIGIDLSTTSIKLVSLDENNILEEYGIFDLPVSANDTDIILGLKGLLAKNFKSKDVVMGLRGLDVLTKLIKVKYGEYDEVEKQVEEIVKDILPVDRNEVEVSWEVIGQENEMVNLLLIIIPNSVIERYERLITGAGLNILAAEINSLAIKRALDYDSNQEIKMIVDIHADETNIEIYNQSVLSLDKTISIGGMQITRNMSKKMAISIPEAEKQKRTNTTISEKIFNESYKPVGDDILAEVGRVMSMARLDYGIKVGYIGLSGGDFNAIEFREYFIDNLSEFAKTELSIPKAVESSLNIDKNSGDRLRLINAVGLAMKY
ncbi:MAG: pilus assembly protein PilM [Patescibacteria group bacterium]